jgi:hypothetical protein
MRTWGKLIGTAAACCAVLALSTSTLSTTAAATTPVTAPAATADTASAAVPDTAVPADTVSAAAPADTVSAAAPAAQAPAGGWETVEAPGSCMCSDGSPFRYFVHQGDPTKVLFFLQGGGACFSADTCGPASTSYKRALGPNDPPALDSGIFDLSRPENPFASYSIVFVPYCTGDVHIGNTTKDYGNGVVVRHNGYINGTTALGAMASRFPEATHVVVAGESAGSVPAPLYAGLTHDLLPTAEVRVLADGSGAYPDVPAINAVVGGSWGTGSAIPAWPENAGLTAETWSFPGLFIQAGKHDPGIIFARHDYAFDQTQTMFAALAGVDSSKLDTLIDKNEAQVEAAGINLSSYISPGDNHTVLHDDAFYTEEQNGVKLVDWVSELLAGKQPADNHCTQCGADAAGG